MGYCSCFQDTANVLPRKVNDSVNKSRCLHKKEKSDKKDELLKAFAVQNPETAWRLIEGQAAIVTPEDGVLRLLNSVGTFIWTRIEKPVSLSNLIKAVMRKFDVTEDRAKKDIIGFIKRLESSKMLLISSNKKDLPAC